ncbi:MAG TPA: chromosome partitioning protein ParB, partial [Acidimicrobiia bacterium]|nr:chromosome partitioning protein ParB [Acidimicrobiia bacterium]
RSAVSITLRLLKLPGAVQRRIDSGALSAGHARALEGLQDEKYAVYLAEKAAKDGLSVRQVEDAVRDRKAMAEPPVATGVRQIRPVEIIELDKRLADKLGSKVKINYRNEKGKVEIRFASLEDLERIYRILS